MPSFLNYDNIANVYTSSRDRGDGQPVTDVAILGPDGETPVSSNNALPVELDSSDIMQPVDVQSHYQQTIQTHNGVTVAASGWNIGSSWIDCAGFDKIAITMLCDSLTINTSAFLYWSDDGSTIQGGETIITPASNFRAACTDIKARYAKLSIGNGDDAAAHVMSAWSYLKA